MMWSLFGSTDLPEFGARGGFGEGLVVAVDVLGVGKLAGLAGNASEEFQRRRYGVARRHVVHQFGGDARVLQVLLDQLGVLFVDLLRGGSSGRGRRFPLPGLAKSGAGNQSASQQSPARCNE